eukprot:5233440-Alexandrium_andersonii.AAC.1
MEMLNGSEVPSPGFSVKASNSSAVQNVCLPWSPFGTGTSGKGDPPNTGGGPAAGAPGLATAIWGGG